MRPCLTSCSERNPCKNFDLAESEEVFMSAFIYALNNADVIRVDGSPLLTSFEHDEDDEIVTFRWVA